MTQPLIATRRMTGILMILVPIVFTICFTVLQMQFEYPDILRQPTLSILTKFQAGGDLVCIDADRGVVYPDQLIATRIAGYPR